MTRTIITSLNKQALANLNDAIRQEIGDTYSDFIDIASTATSRATFYNTAEEQKNKVLQAHNGLINLERGIYGLSLLLPGITDFSKQIGLINLLSRPVGNEALLGIDNERILIEKLLHSLPVHRQLNMFAEIREKRINNARTRKLILKTILNSSKLEFWSVKYRKKIALALEHAFGKTNTGIIKSILSKLVTSWDEKETDIIKKNIDKFVFETSRLSNVYECVKFIFGYEKSTRLPLHKAYSQAKREISKGKLLPFEVLEGIRSTYHPDVSPKAVLELTNPNLTKNQKLTFQRKAEKEGVNIDINLADYDAVKLYIYAFERGLSKEIAEALQKRADESLKKLPFTFGTTGILIDNSQSMAGNETQAMRPLAISLAVRDVLKNASKEATILYTNGNAQDEILPLPSGHTDLALSLIQLLKTKPEHIFIITDGYENATAGRTDEVLKHIKQMGIETPITQLTPVMAAESKGLRKLSQQIAVVPISNADTLSLGVIRGLFKSDFAKAIEVFIEYSLKLLN